MTLMMRVALMMMMMKLMMMVQVMEKTLSKLATFDEGSMMGSMLGFVVSIAMMMTIMKYRPASISTHRFMSSNSVHIRQFYITENPSLTCHLSEQEDQCDWVWN